MRYAEEAAHIKIDQHPRAFHAYNIERLEVGVNALAARVHVLQCTKHVFADLAHLRRD
jgi:hypothetical protein